ncbi:MAG: CRISPR-associated endonuclease Cas3'', partial [Aquificaceae bacterium]|nr:CRISPR-associated endonuclease Cas3'' [Aquificaceae bacterium]
MSLREKLKKAWAKSDGTTIREHTDRLLDNLKRLRELYGLAIERACPEEYRNQLWRALELACEYHDYGKLHCKFQREVLRNRSYGDKCTVERVKHNLLSPAFMESSLEEPLRDLIALAIIHHHDTETGEDVARKVEKVLEDEFQLSMPAWLKKLLRRSEYEALTLIGGEDEICRFYVLLKGLLLRIDHSSSNSWIDVIEGEPTDRVAESIREKKGFQLNDLQSWVYQNRDKNLVVTAPTGYGKTEAGFLFLEGKGFYTIPIRTSANAIYLRAKELFEDKAGL